MSAHINELPFTWHANHIRRGAVSMLIFDGWHVQRDGLDRSVFQRAHLVKPQFGFSGRCHAMWHVHNNTPLTRASLRECNDFFLQKTCQYHACVDVRNVEHVAVAGSST